MPTLETVLTATHEDRGFLLPGALSLGHAAGSVAQVLTADMSDCGAGMRIAAFITEEPRKSIFSSISASRPGQTWATIHLRCAAHRPGEVSTAATGGREHPPCIL